MLQVDSSENCLVNDKNSGVGERIGFFLISFTELHFVFICSFSISSIISLYSISSVCESLAVRSNTFLRGLLIGAPNKSDGSPVARYSGWVACRNSFRGGSFLFLSSLPLLSLGLALFTVPALLKLGSIEFALNFSFRRLPMLEADNGRAFDGRLDATGLISTSTS